MIYRTKGEMCWDEIAIETMGSVEYTSEIQSYQPQALLEYFVVPPNTVIYVPVKKVVTSTVFKAPWDEDDE